MCKVLPTILLFISDVQGVFMLRIFMHKKRLNVSFQQVLSGGEHFLPAQLQVDHQSTSCP